MNCELCRSESCELCKTELWRYWEEKKEAMLPNLSRNSKELMGKTVTCRKNRQMIETLNATDKDCFPNIYKILEIPCISPLASTGAERVASGIRRLKTAYWSTVTDERERNLNLIQLQGMVEIDTIKVANIFIKSGRRGLMHDLPPRKVFKI